MADKIKQRGNLSHAIHALIKKGKLFEAKSLCEERCKHDHNDGDAWFLLGAINGQLGKIDEVIHCCTNCLKIRPDHIDAHYNLAQAYMHMKNMSAAENCYRSVLGFNPKHVLALNNLGVILRMTSRLAEALNLHQTAMHERPDDVETLVNIGDVLLSMGKGVEALKYFKKVLQIDSRHVKAYFRISTTLIILGKQNEAIRILHILKSMAHGKPDVYANIGSVLVSLGRHEEAIDSYKKSLKLDPDSAEVHLLISNALFDLGKLEHSKAHLRKILKANPGRADVYQYLGRVYMRQGRHLEADEAFRTALNKNDELYEAGSWLLLNLNYYSNDPGKIFNAHLEWARRHTRYIPVNTRHKNLADPDRRIRIGYMSPDLRTHSVGYFLEPLLVHHDNEVIEIFCYADVLQADDVTARLRGASDCWRSTTGLSDSVIAEQIIQDKIDILVDLAGHTASKQMLVFARKPAPVQIAYLGYPNTSGLSVMDYRLTDALSDPVGLTDNWYTEKLVRLPEGFLSYMPPKYHPGIKSLPVIQNKYVTFGSFNTLSKITEEVITLWSGVLKAVEDSRLILKNKSLSDKKVCARYKEMFAKNGINISRVELLGWEPALHSHLDRYNNIDIALDPFPYNGTTTTCEALFMGVPVITLAGNTHVGRVGVSILTQVDLCNFIAGSHEEYISIAQLWAGRVSGLKRIRDGLRDRLYKSSLCDGAGFANNVEKAYRTIWRNWCNDNSRIQL